MGKYFHVAKEWVGRPRLTMEAYQENQNGCPVYVCMYVKRPRTVHNDTLNMYFGLIHMVIYPEDVLREKPE